MADQHEQADDVAPDRMEEMLDRWARTGELDGEDGGTEDATDAALRNARATTHSADMFLGSAGGHIQKTARTGAEDRNSCAFAQFAAQADARRLPIDRLAERLVNAPAALFEASGPKKPRALTFQGIKCYIENPAGSTRRGKNSDGTPWETVMRHDYGYITGVDGADGDELDVFIGPDAAATHAYVVHQQDPETGIYDEDKVMLGFSDQEKALQAYRDNYDRDMPLEGVTSSPMPSFKAALKDAENGVFRWKQRQSTLGDVALKEQRAGGEFSAGRVLLPDCFGRDELAAAMRMLQEGP